MRSTSLVAILMFGAAMAVMPTASQASEGELCWVRINQQTIFGEKINGICRFQEIRLQGEKLREGRPYRPDLIVKNRNPKSTEIENGDTGQVIQ